MQPHLVVSSPDSDRPQLPRQGSSSSIQLGKQAPPNSQADSASELSGGTTPVDRSFTLGPETTTLRVGQSGKSFTVHRDLLCARSPYFRELFARHDVNRSTSLSYPELDEFACHLFVRYLYGAKLVPCTDYHTMQHFLCLYVLARFFRVERLTNEVMDNVRAYYRHGNFTAPQYRLEYIYAHTFETNHMRDFLVKTAAYRVLCEGQIGDAVKPMIEKGGHLAIDFAEALVEMRGDNLVDPRKGSDCAWHDHTDTQACRRVNAEAYEAP